MVYWAFTDTIPAGRGREMELRKETEILLGAVGSPSSPWSPLVMRCWGACCHLTGMKIPAPDLAFLTLSRWGFGMSHYGLVKVEI